VFGEVVYHSLGIVVEHLSLLFDAGQGAEDKVFKSFIRQLGHLAAAFFVAIGDHGSSLSDLAKQVAVSHSDRFITVQKRKQLLGEEAMGPILTRLSIRTLPIGRAVNDTLAFMDNGGYMKSDIDADFSIRIASTAVGNHNAHTVPAAQNGRDVAENQG
jgi:soluble P-type ATPase